jgi:hypothetical protein
MSTLTQFGGGSDIGSIVPGHFPGNPRYLPCDGVSMAPAVNSTIGAMYPRVTQAVTVQADQNSTAAVHSLCRRLR